MGEVRRRRLCCATWAEMLEGSRFGLLALVAAYVLSRFPLCLVGFGNDGDAWSMASNASDIVRGTYRISRLPGHPFYEGLYSAGTVLGGPVACNLLTVGLSVILLRMVWRLGEVLEVHRPAWAAVALATQPIFWVSSADSTDFILATLLGTSSILAAVHGRSLLCGVCLGMAVATRAEMALYVIPLVILGRGLRSPQVVTAAVLTAAVFFIPVGSTLYESNWREWFTRVFLMPEASPRQWVLLFAARAWAVWGLISLTILCVIIAIQRERIISLVLSRDPLIFGSAGLGAAYLAMTLVHPSKSTYFVPLLPLALLGIMHVATRWQRLLLVLSFAIYAGVYPDVVDMVDGQIQFGFRWNNGVVVKEWIARWNTVLASEMIEQNRPRGPSVLVLGYWLPVWRYGNPASQPVTDITGLGNIDTTLNQAYRTEDGAWVIHNVDRASVSKLAAAGKRLVYGEGIDAFLQETQGFDVKTYGATEVRVRSLGKVVAERFTLPVLVGCGFAHERWEACVTREIGEVVSAAGGSEGTTDAAR
jgi:hypothetical protein